MAKEQDTVCGIFPDQSQAQRAIKMLQSAGFQAQIGGGGKKSYSGFSDDEAGLYESRANEGNTIVTVSKAGNRGEEATNIMLEAGAENIDMRSNQAKQQDRRASYYQTLDQKQRQYGTVNAQTGQGRNAEELRVQLREEELTANKTAQQAGEVQVRKTVHEEEREIPVNLKHEEVTIERHAVNRPLQGGEIGDLQDEVINVPIYEEQAQLQKQGRVAEEVVINKDVVQDQETLRGTVRREDVDIDRTGDARVQGDINTQGGYDTDTHTHGRQ